MDFKLVLFVVVAAIIVLMTLRKLLYGVYFLILLAPLERVFVTRNFGLNIKLAEWMGLLCIMAFLWSYLVRPRRNAFPFPVLLPLLIFALVNIILGLFQIPEAIKFAQEMNFNSAGFRIIKVVTWCIFSILVSLSVCYAIKDEKDLRKCVNVLLISTLAICTISLISMVLNIFGVHFETWSLIGRKGFIGIKGTFSEPQYLSLYLAPIVPLALFMFILRVYRLGLLFTVAGSFTLLLANYFSFSTTGLAGITLIIIAIPFIIKHYRMVTAGKAMRYSIILALSIYIVFLAGAFFNVDFIKVTVSNYFDKMAKQDSRWAGRVMGQKMFMDHPFIGVGPGNWAWKADQEYKAKVTKETFVRPSYNCLYWEILTDLGIAGFIPFVWFFITMLRALSKSIWRANDTFLKAAAAGLMVGIATLLGEYYVTFNFYRIHVWPIFGLAFAVIQLSLNETKKSNE
ncbi:MAG: O-antigen ligase family protein [Candidatus Omnitrophica bacterium]|nr:O-antigen ligase family protein [Candidatus Omnitrophota bacterium]